MRSARAVSSARGRAGLWRRPRSSICPLLPPIYCGMAAPGAMWCRRCCPPASCRPLSQVRCLTPPSRLDPVLPPAHSHPPAPLRVLPQLSGPPSVRGARWPCCSTSTACTACCSEYRAGTGRRGGRSLLAALTPCVCPAATSEPWVWLSRRTLWS